MDYTLQNRSAVLSDIDKDNDKDNEKSKFLKVQCIIMLAMKVTGGTIIYRRNINISFNIFITAIHRYPEKCCS